MGPLYYAKIFHLTQWKMRIVLTSFLNFEIDMAQSMVKVTKRKFLLFHIYCFIRAHLLRDTSLYVAPCMFLISQSVSVELGGFKRLVEYVRTVELALGDGVKKITEKEKSIRAKLAPI
jgi:hypothetical protein